MHTNNQKIMYPFRIIDLCLLVNLQIQNINKRNQDIKAPTFLANKNNAVIAIILNRNPILIHKFNKAKIKLIILKLTKLIKT